MAGRLARLDRRDAAAQKDNSFANAIPRHGN